MPNYHLYFMLRGAPVGTQTIEAGDDAEAKRIACQLTEGDAVEIWNDHRRLGIVGASRPGDEAVRRGSPPSRPERQAVQPPAILQVGNL